MCQIKLLLDEDGRTVTTVASNRLSQLGASELLYGVVSPESAGRAADKAADNQQGQRHGNQISHDPNQTGKQQARPTRPNEAAGIAPQYQRRSRVLHSHAYDQRLTFSSREAP